MNTSKLNKVGRYGSMYSCSHQYQHQQRHQRGQYRHQQRNSLFLTLMLIHININAGTVHDRDEASV